MIVPVVRQRISPNDGCRKAKKKKKIISDKYFRVEFVYYKTNTEVVRRIIHGPKKQWGSFFLLVGVEWIWVRSCFGMRGVSIAMSCVIIIIIIIIIRF